MITLIAATIVGLFCLVLLEHKRSDTATRTIDRHDRRK
jgi:hypothetical protein